MLIAEPAPVARVGGGFAARHTVPESDFMHKDRRSHTLYESRARKIAGGEVEEWPVIEVNGKWFILQNQGQVASDGFFAVTIVDVETKELVGHITDNTGNMPEVAPVPRRRRSVS